MHLNRQFLIGLIGHLLLGGAISPLYSQEPQDFRGYVQWGGYQGLASYRYVLVEGDTVLHGPFSLQSRGLEASPFGEQPYISFGGEFSEGQLDSSWVFQFGDFEAGDRTEWEGEYIRVPVSGRRHRAEAHFEQGLAQGSWTHLIEQIEDSEQIDTVLTSELMVEKGLPTENFRIEDKGLILLGRFMAPGLAHDVWTFNYKTAVDKLEHWSFAAGRLEKIWVQRGEEADSLGIYPDELAQSQTIDLNARYIRILSLQGRFDSAAYAGMGGQGQQLLLQHAALNERLSEVLQALGDSAQANRSPRLGVKVAHYPLSQSETKQLERIRNRLRVVDATRKEMLGNTRLNLLRRADQEVGFYLAVAEQVAGPYLAPARRALAYEDESVLAFLPRTRLLPAGVAQAKAWPAIEVELADTTGGYRPRFAGPQVAVPPTDSQALAYLAGLCQYALAALDSIEQVLDQKLDRQAFQAELASLEKELLQETETLDSLIDSLEQVIPARYASALMALETLANQRLRQYSDEEKLQAKLTLAQESIACTQQLRQLARTLATLPRRWDEIQQLYTEEVWNPFTATAMEDQVKERITQAYDGVLIPFLLSEIKQGLSCDRVESHINTLDALYARMQELRKQRTSQLERKLKQAEGPEAVLQWFELPL